MDLGLKDKSVLVMASGGGIGLGIATEFAREGANVMLFDLSEDALKTAQEGIFKVTGKKPAYTVGSITNPADIIKVAANAEKEHGPIYALFNNTGGPPPGGFTAFDDEAWQKAFELTLLSYIRTIRAVLPSMEKGEGGRIVNNSSSSIKRVIDNLILSNTMRTGVMGLTKSIAREFGPKRILANCIGPGKIDTPRVGVIDTNKAKKLGVTIEEMQAKEKAEIPLGRYGTTEELARFVVWLGSAANTYISGQNILVDGAAISAY
jgi:3-oxoacyl-[acyl-carrier protein] reductase